MEPKAVAAWFSNFHLGIRSVFDEMEVTTEAMQRRRLARHLAEELQTHATVEKDLLYPFLRNISSEVGRWVEQVRLVHRSIDGMAHELLTVDFSTDRLEGFRNMVTRCLEDEETRLFPALASLDDANADELQRRIDGYRRDSNVPRAADQSRKRPGNSGH